MTTQLDRRQCLAVIGGTAVAAALPSVPASPARIPWVALRLTSDPTSTGWAWAVITDNHRDLGNKIGNEVPINVGGFKTGEGCLALAFYDRSLGLRRFKIVERQEPATALHMEMQS